eukprot:3868878-Amphidinium_carterae.1
MAIGVEEGQRDPDGVPGLVEPLGSSVVPVYGVDVSIVLHEHPGVGSVWVGGSAGTPGPVGPVDRIDSWSGALLRLSRL